MLNLLNRLFRRKSTVPSFDIEKTVGRYLLTLPRCSNRILVISRSFQGERYNYEMIVNTASLAAWAEEQDISSWGLNDPEKAAWKVWLLWLRLADLTDNTVSMPPLILFEVISKYHETFLEMPGTEVFCHECSKMIERLILTNTQLPKKEIFNVMRYEWHCPESYLLYLEVKGRHGYSGPLFDKNDLNIPSFLRKQAD